MLIYIPTIQEAFKFYRVAMKKLLAFEIKHNLRRPPRVYVKSPDLKTVYGSFSYDNTNAFENWEALTIAQTIELKQFIQNINAINAHIQPEANTTLTEFRLRLPVNLVHTLNELSAIGYRENIELNVYDAIVLNIIQQMKIYTAKLSEHAKTEAFALLEKAGIAEYKKHDYSSQVQSIFTELLNIKNKSEKLHEKARLIFEKNKSYSPKAIESMATGEINPSKWLVSCAIDVLIDENMNMRKAFSEDDLFMLWIKPQLDHHKDPKPLEIKAQHIVSDYLVERIKKYVQYKSDITKV